MHIGEKERLRVRPGQIGFAHTDDSQDRRKSFSASTAAAHRPPSANDQTAPAGDATGGNRDWMDCVISLVTPFRAKP